MKIPAKTDYACRALLELSSTWPNTIPRQGIDIAKKQNIPTQFLTHILINLKSLGYVASARGKSGGYYLVVPPKEIKLSQIIRQFGGLGLAPEDKHEKVYEDDAIGSIWSQVNDIVLKSLDQINFEEIKSRSVRQLQTVSFDI